MMRIFINKFCLLLYRGLILFLTLLSTEQRAFGCFDDSWRCSPSGFCDSFFAPEIIDDKKSSPFFHANQEFYDGKWIAVSDAVYEANIEEWKAFFESKISQKFLSELVYKASIEDIDKLILALKGKGTPSNGTLKDVYTLVKKNNLQELAIKGLYYLGFAKRVEPLATAGAGYTEWDEADDSKPLEDDKYQKLIKGGESLLEHAQYKFLIERYRFQIMRIMFYSGRFKEVTRYYKTYYPLFHDENSIKYRFLHLAAGAFYRFNQSATDTSNNDENHNQANYLYSIIFSHFPPLQKSALSSFSFREEKDWKLTLELAKNVREKTILWQMLGITRDGTRAISEIFALDSSSDLLPLLLVREVNLFEEAIFELPNLGGKSLKDNKATAMSATLKTIKMVADSNKLPKEKSWLWYLATGHLFALSGEEENAQIYLSKAKNLLPPKNKFAYGQWRMSRLLARTVRIAGLEGDRLKAPIKKEDEDFLASELTWLGANYKSTKDDVDRKARLYEWLRAYLSKIYLKNGDSVRAFLLEDKPEDPRYHDNAQIDQILKVVANSKKSPFDAFLTTAKAISPATQYTAADLFELKGINMLFAGNFIAAAEFFKKGVPVKLQADPFVIHVKDCHDCDQKLPKNKTYTKLDFAEKMAQLFEAAQGNVEAAAHASFELANGFYNMSYFGNSRDIYYTSHNNTPTLLYYSSNLDKPNAPLKRQVKMSEAHKYYQRAFNLSSDKEMQAQALFMTAKTEYNSVARIEFGHSATQAVLQEWLNYQRIGPGSQFKTLAEKYSDTFYYKEIIKECGYFRTFLSK